MITGSRFSGQALFYYGRGGEKVPLELSQEKLVVKLRQQATKREVVNVLETVTGVETIEPVSAFPGFYQARLQNPVSTGQMRQHMQALRNNPQVAVANPVYLVQGLEAIPGDRFVVRFKPAVSRSRIDSLNQQHHVKIVRSSTAIPDYYVFRITGQTSLSVVEAARLYFEELPAIYALPDFVQPIERHDTPGDPYYSYQYYFNNSNNIDINAPGAWDFSKGSSQIVVAVIDDGVEVHEDLSFSRLVTGYDAFGNGITEPVGNNAHGMAVSGIVAAGHNSNGVAGLAPNVNVMPVRIFDQGGRGARNDQIVDAINYAWQNGANILSNSWGYGSCATDFVPQVTDAIEAALTNGRGGKGSVVVFSAGNTASRSTGDYGCVTFPANVPDVITVGAIDRSGNIQYYSSRDSQVQSSAPIGEARANPGWPTN